MKNKSVNLKDETINYAGVGFGVGKGVGFGVGAGVGLGVGLIVRKRENKLKVWKYFCDAFDLRWCWWWSRSFTWLLLDTTIK